MWCPKCKTEYGEGITICVDCGSDLISKLPLAGYVNICEINDEETADEIAGFLEYSDIEDVVKESLEDSSGFRIMVPEKSAGKAEKVFQGYLLAKEEEKEEKEKKEKKRGTASETEDFSKESGDDRILEKNPLLVDEVDENTVDMLYTSEKKEYVKKAEQYSDMKFSGITFVVFGVIGIVYLLLSKFQVIPIVYNPFVFFVLVILFMGFVVSGCVSFARAGKIKLEIPAEEKKIKEIMEWLQGNITKNKLEQWKDKKVSESENDLLLIAHIQLSLMKQYPEEDKAFLELLADEFYGEHFLGEGNES